MMDTPKALDRKIREVVAAKEEIRLKSENFVIRIFHLLMTPIGFLCLKMTSLI